LLRQRKKEGEKRKRGGEGEQVCGSPNFFLQSKGEERKKKRGLYGLISSPL